MKRMQRALGRNLVTILSKNNGKNIKLAMVLCVLMLFANSADAAWTIYYYADLKNTERDTLRIRLSPDQSLRIWLILPSSQAGAFASRMPLYRIDDNPVRDLQDVETLITNKKKDRWIHWKLATVQDGVNGELLDWVNGKSVVFQYYLPGGRIKEATFLLEGIREVITRLMNSNVGIPKK